LVVSQAAKLQANTVAVSNLRIHPPPHQTLLPWQPPVFRTNTKSSNDNSSPRSWQHQACRGAGRSSREIFSPWYNRHAPATLLCTTQKGSSLPMTARVATVAFQSIDVLDIDVQVQMGSGLLPLIVVGLPRRGAGWGNDSDPFLLSFLLYCLVTP